MNWLRSKAKRLSVLALLALALQFGMSFGHVHADAGLAMASAATGQPLASVPGDNDPDHDRNLHRDLCAICVSAALTGHAVTAALPSFAPPLSFNAARAVLLSEALAPDHRHDAFRSRAPPRS